MATIINADTVTGGAVITGDASGQLALQAAGVTKLTVNSSGVTLATPLPVASGGTGSTSAAFVNLTSNVTGTLPVLSGGTGATTLATNNVLLGNGGSALQTVAPGTAGNLLTSNGTTWASTAPAAAGGTTTATSTGSITAGQAVQINTDGTVSAPTVTYTTTGTTAAAISAAANNNWGSLTYLPLIDRYLATYYRTSDSYFVAQVGTPSATGAVSWGAVQVIYSGAGSNRITAVYVSSQGNVVAAFNISSSVFLIAISVSSAGTITVGSVANLCPGTISNAGWYGLAYSPVVDRILATSMNNNIGGYLTSSSIQLIGLSITNYSYVNNIFNQTTNGPPYLVYDPASDKFLMIGAFTSNYMYCWIGTVAVGGATTWLSPQLLTTTIPGSYLSSTYSSGSSKSVISFFPNDSTNKTATITVTGGTSVSLGTIVSFSNNNTSGQPAISYDSGLDRIVYFYKNVNAYPSVRTGAISGTDISLSAETVIQAIGINASSFLFCSYSYIYKYSLCTYWTTTTDYQYTTVKIGSSTLSTNNFIGFAANTVSTGQTTTVTVVGGINANQTGLTPALKYYVQQTGGLSTSVSDFYGGISMTATKLLVKG